MAATNTEHPGLGDTGEEARQLREHAEARTTSEHADLAGDPSSEQNRLIHELRVHQIELEMQNEELRAAREQLEASRARYIELYELAPVAYLTVDKVGKVIEANLTAAALLQVPRRTLLSSVVTRYVLPAAQDTYYRVVRTLFATGASQTCELRMLPASGAELWVRLEAAAAPFGPTGETVAHVTLSDITKEKQAEAALLRMAKLEAVGTLAAGIAHEFNNLLGSLFGFLELAQLEAQARNQPEIAAFLGHALGSFDRAKSLTMQLLTFSKGGAPIRTSQSIVELVRKAVWFALSGSNLAPTFTIPEGIWLCDCDADQITRVIENLVINARQAMPEGGQLDVTVENAGALSLLGLPPMSDYVRISIQDHGPGIPADVAPHLFEAFFSTKATGSGLGLATSLSIVRQHGGIIDFHTRVGQGTVFHVYLPASVQPISRGAPNSGQSSGGGRDEAGAGRR